MRRILLSLSVCFLVTSAGSASSAPNKVTVIFHSDPEGATLYEGLVGSMQPFGPTPVSLVYETTKGFRSNKECLRTRPVMVRWPSGAEASIAYGEACPQNGANQQLTFVRPTGVPGREFDVMVAIERERTNLIRQQLAAANRQASAAELAAVLDRFKPAPTPAVQNYVLPMPQSSTPQRPTHCTSQVVGAFVYTNCN